MKPVEYQPGPFDTKVDPETLTEVEHQDSCDINKMILNAHRGMNIRGGGSNTYGYDDLTMDGVSFRIEKERLENELSQVPKEMEEEALALIPEKIKTKFGFKVKPKQNAQNDDKTTNNANPTQTPTQTPNVQPTQS